MGEGEITEGQIEQDHESLQGLRMRKGQGPAQVHTPSHVATVGMLALSV